MRRRYPHLECDVKNVKEPTLKRKLCSKDDEMPAKNKPITYA